MTNLMKDVHSDLKESIKLLDAIRWMERAVRILLQSGNELSQVLSTGDFHLHLEDLARISRPMNTFWCRHLRQEAARAMPLMVPLGQ
jgi:hypothetical protein